MRNRPNNRKSPRRDHHNRWEGLRDNPDPPAQQPVETEPKSKEGQSTQTPSEGFSDFGFLGWDEMLPPPNTQGDSESKGSLGHGFRDGQPDGRGWDPQYHPDAWLDQPLPWEMPPPGANESGRGAPLWEHNRTGQDREPNQRMDSPGSRQESRRMDPPESGKFRKGREWEDFPSLYDELEEMESPRARIKGSRPRRVRSRNRRQKW